MSASLVETLLALLAIAALLPVFGDLAGVSSAGRGDRYAQAELLIAGLPPPVLPDVCRTHAAGAELQVRERLCANVAPASHGEAGRLPQALVDALVRVKRVFGEPFEKAQARAADLRLQQREGVGDLLALADAIGTVDADLRPFIQRYALGGGPGVGPMPLHCAVSAIETALARAAGPARVQTVERNNAILLLAAAIDGHGAVKGLAANSVLPAAPERPAGCEEPLANALASAAALLAGARQADMNARKSEAMRELLRSAGWQWAGWMALGLVLVKLSRRQGATLRGAALSLATWAAVAWACRVPWPLAGERAFEPGRSDPAVLSPPAAFVWALLGCAAALWLLAGRLPPRPAPAPQTLSSRIGYPGLVLASGIGWALLLDLSANGHFSNRYLGLYHQGHLWLGMLVLTTLLFMRQPLARAAGSMLALLDAWAGSIGRRFATARARSLLLLLVLMAVWVLGSLLLHVRQLTSEIGRLWLIVGGAWFFFLRGGPLAERLARTREPVLSLIGYALPLWLVLLGLFGWMFVTRDMGPLLIAAYGGGAFVAASAGMWWYQRKSVAPAAVALATLVLAAWVAALTIGLFELGSLDAVAAGRLESVAAPLASANDQLALVTWFREAAPAAGFGLGAVPWCGYGSGSGCAGVPVQIHSDYTFTAMVGAFGEPAAWAVALACAFWLHRLIRHHGHVTAGEPRLVRSAAYLSTDDQAFVSWLCVAWVVLSLCQLAVTVGGNLAVLPLTGVTFPFVSFGMTSLLVNMAFLALCLNVNLPVEARGA